MEKIGELGISDSTSSVRYSIILRYHLLGGCKMGLQNATRLGMLCLLLSGCATIPDVATAYYFPKAHTQFVVTQTVGCSPLVANKHRLLRSVITVAATTTDAADLDWKENGSVRQGRFRFKALNGTFSDGDGTVTLTADGRLSAINATTAGQGGAIIKDVVTVAGAVMMLGGPPPATFVPNDEDNACAEVDNYSSVGAKPEASLVTLTYSLNVGWSVSDAGKPVFVVDRTATHAYDGSPGELTSIDLKPAPASKPAFDAIQTILKTRLAVRLAVPDQPLVYVNTIENGKDAARETSPIELSRVAMVAATIEGSAGSMNGLDRVWAATLPVPTHQLYSVLMPMPHLFGKTAFGLGLSDANTITSLHYGQNTGTAEATDALGAVLTAAQPKSAADKAKEIQGQADLIAQQQRLVACEVAPAQCK